MFDRSLWRESFGDWPSWPCPACNSVALSLPKDKAKEWLVLEETGPSKRAHDHDEWEPEWADERFTALLRCHNPACGELVAVAGNASPEEYIDEDPTGEWHRGYASAYRPTYFEKAPPIFAIPSQCPTAVANQLTSAFSLIWCDPASAANRMRAGVEALLNDQGVVKSTVANGKRIPLTTHSRIEKFKTIHGEAAKYLMAIKWLGNNGSHESLLGLTRDQLLDGAELFEAAIELLYLKKAEKFGKIAAEITKRKGKPKKTHKKSGLF